MSNDRDQELLELKALMEQEQFRRFILRIMGETGLGSSGFDADPLEHARKAGRRQVGHWVADEVKEATKNGYLKMIKEHMDD